jgi:hypothetical protein
MNMLISISCLIPSAPLPTLDKVMVCQPPDFPTADEVLEKLDIPLNMKSRISDPLQHLLKSLYNDKVLLSFKEKIINCNAMLKIREELKFHQNVYKKYVNNFSNPEHGNRRSNCKTWN